MDRLVRLTLSACGALAISTLALTAQAQSSLTQVIVSGTTNLKSTSASSVRDAGPAALNAAYRNAWRLMSTRPEFASKLQTLPPGAEDKIVDSLQSECSVTPLDQDVDKDTRQLSARYRFDCRTQSIQSLILSLNSRPSANETSGSDGDATIVFLFFAERDRTRRDFDPTVSRTSSDSNSRSSAEAFASGATLQASARVSASSKQGEIVNKQAAGSKSAQITTQKAIGKESVMASEAATATQSSDAQTSTSSSSRSSGQTVVTSAEYTREVSRPDKLDAALKEVFLTTKIVSLADYTDVQSCSASAPPIAQIESDLRSLRSDQSFALPQATRAKVIASLRECEVPYFATAVAKIGIPDVDPASGQKRVFVDVTAQVLNIRSGGLPKTVGSVTRQLQGIGPDETVATSNALSAAARVVGEETLNMLSVRGAL